jgi:RNA polymerase sigma factor (sigma-70 family)
MNSVLRHLRRAVLLSGAEGLPDEQLLTAFLLHREEAAFEAMLRRHGPMVLGVCRRILRNSHDAEDAFQATFLVLARKAGSIRSQQVLASWLYGVAYRTAMKARTMNMKRREREREAGACSGPKRPADGASEELLERLDHELNRLPEKYRVPVVLCELEGHGRKEAARILGVPEGTLSWRLAQARKVLTRRLARFGTVTVAALLAEAAASARPSPMLLKSTAQAVLKAGAVPAQVLTLTQGVLKAMLLTKLKITACAAALMLLAGISVTGLTYQATGQQFNPGPDNGIARESRPQADDLESLRLEIEALRKELRATRERVKALEVRVEGPRGYGAGAAETPPRPKEAERDSWLRTPPANRFGEKGKRTTESPFAGKEKRTTEDPFAIAEEALKRLRRNPDDEKAAEDLERALRRLKPRSLDPEKKGYPEKQKQ